MDTTSTSAKLAAMLDPRSDVVATGETPAAIVRSVTEAATSSSGRGPTGRLRNFAQMAEAKLAATLAAVEAEADDEEAIDAVRAEIARREGER